MHKLDTSIEHGLASSEAEQRLQKYGRNELAEKKKNPVLAYLSFMWNPLSWAMVPRGHFKTLIPAHRKLLQSWQSFLAITLTLDLSLLCSL